MEWITKAAKERDDWRLRRETIERDAPALWQQVGAAMEEAVKEYEEIESRPRKAKLIGRVAHAVHVAVFERKGQTQGMQIGRIAVVFDRKQSAVEIRTVLGGTARKLPVSLNHQGKACLMHDGHEISIDEFAKLALCDMFFPKDDGTPLDAED